MDTLIQDLKYAIRQLARMPMFTVVAAVTLAIGIGANTALFSLIEAVFIRPLPGVKTDGRLVWIAAYAKRGGHAVNLSYPDFISYRDEAGVFVRAAALGRTDFSLC